jgi:hypothetical protein
LFFTGKFEQSVYLANYKTQPNVLYKYYWTELIINIIGVIKSGRIRWEGHVARMGKRRGVYRVLVEKLEGKRPLGRPMHRWEDNIKMDLQEVG